MIWDKNFPMTFWETTVYLFYWVYMGVLSAALFLCAIFRFMQPPSKLKTTDDVEEEDVIPLLKDANTFAEMDAYMHTLEDTKIPSGVVAHFQSRIDLVEKQKASLVEESSAHIQGLSKIHAEDQARLAQYEEEARQQARAYKAEIRSLKEKLESLETCLKTQGHEAAQEKASLLTQVKFLQEQLLSVKDDRGRSQGELQEDDQEDTISKLAVKSVSDAKHHCSDGHCDDILKLVQTIRKYKLDICKMREQHVTEVEAMNVRHAATVSDYEAKLDARKKDHETELDQIHSACYDRFQLQLADAIQKHASELAFKANEYEVHLCRITRQNHTTVEGYISKIKDLDAKIVEITEQHRLELEAVEMRRKELYTSSINGLEAKYKAYVASIESLHTSRVDDLEAHHKDHVNKITERHRHSADLNALRIVGLEAKVAEYTGRHRSAVEYNESMKEKLATVEQNAKMEEQRRIDLERVVSLPFEKIKERKDSFVLDWISKPVHKRCFFKNCMHSLEREICRKCSRCMIARYCSKHCQKADWTFHKNSCCNPNFFTNDTMLKYAVAIRKQITAPLSDDAVPCLYGNKYLSFRNSYEMHGKLCSFAPNDADQAEYIRREHLYVCLFDENLKRTTLFVTVPISDIVATEWQLE